MADGDGQRIGRVGAPQHRARQQAAHHVLHHAHLLLAALALPLALRAFLAGDAALLQGAEHLLQLGQLAARVLRAAFARGVLHPVRAAVEVALVHQAVLRVGGHGLRVLPLELLGQGFQVLADRVAQLLDALLELGALLVLRFAALALGLFAPLALGVALLLRAVVLALLGAMGVVDVEALADYLVVGELGLDARVAPSPGVLLAALHAAELGNEVPSSPLLFLKPNTSVIGPDDPIVLPSWSEDVHHEAELAVVIGTICKDVPVSRVDDVVFGYTVGNDLTARDAQRTDRETYLLGPDLQV